MREAITSEKKTSSTWKLDRRAMYNADASFIASRVTDAVVPLADNFYFFYVSFLSCTVGSTTATIDRPPVTLYHRLQTIILPQMISDYANRMKM